MDSVLIVQSLSHVWFFATPSTAVCQASLSSTISQSLLKLMSIESMMPSNHFNLCYRLPLYFPSIRVFLFIYFYLFFFKFYFIFKLYITVLVLPNIKMNPPALHFRWPKYWSFSISFPMNIQGWFPLGLTGLISLHSKRLSRVLQHLALIFIDSLKVSLGL